MELFMNEWILGCDIGSSSVKVIKVLKNGEYEVSKAACRNPEAAGSYWDSLVSAVHECVNDQGGRVKAIALTGQVGSYLFFDKNHPSAACPVCSWQKADAKPALDELLSRFDRDFFQREISMPHPPLESYPLPFLLSRKKREFSLNEETMLLSLKDYIFFRMTGEFISDPCTWRGLCDKSGHYSRTLLDFADFPERRLPLLAGSEESVCCLASEAAGELRLTPGIPIYTGCNDFYAGLLGSGGGDENCYYDVTGTSEHFGFLTDRFEDAPLLITSPFFDKFVCYGVTASSGSSLEWARKQFAQTAAEAAQDAPVFLPYLNGERTPLYNGGASGVFWGLRAHHTSADLTRAVMEGVVFSLAHIKSLLPKRITTPKYIRVSGGAAAIDSMNHLKADILGLPILVCGPESTALGAAMIAALGESWFPDYRSAAACWVSAKTIEPMPLNIDYERRFRDYLRIFEAMGLYLSDSGKDRR